MRSLLYSGKWGWSVWSSSCADCYSPRNFSCSLWKEFCYLIFFLSITVSYEHMEGVWCWALLDWAQRSCVGQNHLLSLLCMILFEALQWWQIQYDYWHKLCQFLAEKHWIVKICHAGSWVIWEDTAQVTQDSCCLPSTVLVLWQESFRLQRVSLFTELNRVISDLMLVQTRSNLGKNANRLQETEMSEFSIHWPSL